jgi:hypothetical protein
MLAFLFKEGEAVGVALFKGPGKQTPVKSYDHKMRSKLFRLFNSSLTVLTHNLTDGQCEARPVVLAPGTPEHFIAVVNFVNSNTTPDFVMSTVGLYHAD